ncbi:hypothetical protein ACLB2K_069718 [Fragaria x ananassa]
MSNRESVTLVVEHPKAESDSDSNSEVSREVHISSKKWQAVAKFLGFYWIFTKWKEIFFSSCVFAVLLDPLFLYIPIMNYDMKCLQFDGNLKTATLILRSITDLFYIMDIIVQIHRYKDYSSLFPTIAKTIGRSYIMIDILAILPFPQVVFLTLSSKTRASRSLSTRKLLMNFFLLIQYVPRVLRIYLLCKEPRKSPKATETAIWVKGVLNFFMYILASHVIGAVWYFFAVQRMLDCWQYACRNESGCDTSTFGCHEHRTVRNIKFLNDICPIDPPEAKLFDFGIYLSILQSSIPRSTNFQQKVSNCFCWGLRNLSSLGSNLQPSTNTTENLFVAFVSIIGLLLFIYLIGNLQTYLQLDTARIEVHRHKMKVEGKLEKIDTEIELWLSKNGIPKRTMKDIKSKIMLKVRQELEENRDVDVDQDLISILPLKLQNHIIMPFTRLKQVPLLQKMDERILKAICRELTPVMRYIYGEKLLVWPSLTSFPDKLPPAADSARAVGDVEALVLRFEDMKILGSKLRRYFRKYSKYCTLEEQLTKIHVGLFEEALEIFTTQELKKATNNFDHSRIIGEGGHGEVYKGILPDRTEVAIKRFKRSVHQSEKFVQEVTALSKVSHRHVVRLLGYCIETERPSLILEYIPNGSLYEHIHDKSRGPTLSFKVRMRIAAETAGALAYMHSLPVSIIHGDVKSANILLDDNYSAKVMDFGTSQGRDPDSFTHISTDVCGTFGYLDPEYFMRCIITDRSDVYSFGVVLAELLTSRKAVSRDRPERQVHLAQFLNFTAREGHLDQIFDHEIVNGGNIRTARKVAHLACRCLQMKGVDRPSMKEVATELELFLECIVNHPEEEEEEEDQLESTPSISRTSTFPIEHDDYMLRLDSADVNTDIDDESDDDDDSSHSWVR